MTGGPPLWLIVVWPWAMTVCVFWQPRWAHRLSGWIIGYMDRLLSKLPWMP